MDNETQLYFQILEIQKVFKAYAEKINSAEESKKLDHVKMYLMQMRRIIDSLRVRHGEYIAKMHNIARQSVKEYDLNKQSEMYRKLSIYSTFIHQIGEQIEGDEKQFKELTAKDPSFAMLVSPEANVFPQQMPQPTANDFASLMVQYASGIGFQFNPVLPTVVNFYRPTCGYAMQFMPTWDQFVQLPMLANKLNFVKVNVEDAQGSRFGKLFGVSGTPTIVFVDPTGKGQEYRDVRTVDGLLNFVGNFVKIMPMAPIIQPTPFMMPFLPRAK